MSTSELKMVAIEDIAISKTNPRKTFDEKVMAELADSIKQHGVLQPILVRPRVPAGKNWATWKSAHFELVCGERRYRAAIEAGLMEIPANIRTLTDDEAFELQIVENLERKDVHPLEEADAFKRMLDSGKYTMTDIAAKVAKSEYFIAQRLKLVDLVQELKDDFYGGHFGIGHAILFARLEKEDQLEHYKYARSGWNADPDNPDYDTIAELKSKIEDQSYSLEEAPFPLDANNIVKGICACDKCPKRTISNPVLFSDMQGEDRCMDKKCYNLKLESFIEKEVAKIIIEAMDVILVTDYNGNMPKTVMSILKEYKVQPLKNYDGWNTHQRNGWPYKRVFNVSDGTYSGVYIKPTGNVSKDTGDETSQIQSEIQRIEERMKRNMELADEKAWADITSFKEENAKFDGTLFTDHHEPLSRMEKIALMVSIGQTSWGIKHRFLDALKVENIHDIEVFDREMFKLMRVFINSQLNNSYGGTKSGVGNAVFTAILKEYYPKEVEQSLGHFESFYRNKNDRAELKLNTLKSELKGLKKVSKKETSA